MAFYSILLLSGMFLAYFSQYVGKRRGLLICLFTIAILGAVASFRGYVGTDTYSYHLQFDGITSVDGIDYALLITEPAFIALAKCVDWASGNSFVYVSVIGILQVLLVMYILTKIERPALFLLFYIATFYINFHFNILRASTASLLLLVSMLWIKEGGLKFHITLWSAFLFHYTSILLIVYILMYRQIKEKNYLFALAIFTTLTFIVFSIIYVLSDFATLKYGGYLEEEFKIDRSIGVGLVLQLFLYVGLGVALFAKNKTEAIFFLFPVVLMKLLIVSYPIVGRLIAYFLPILLLVLTKDSFFGWRRQLVEWIVIVLSMLHVIGVVSGLPIADAQGLDSKHSSSPYIPYHTAIDAQ